ncbi:hypothetical protein [Novacetimonas pomaceti]|uniref:hypothetical protein n=1 Tax=Novacetimonas pomaceti TaxID=2021998 RepID=UPI001C2DBE2C|nr:hypothetical protein [Novacetimonas pomaceti]MBV1833048.1 hypothetical protein [Novacetimonas pomaceti]
MTNTQVEQQTAPENNPAQITLLKIREWGACSDGRDWFREKFPQGATYGEVMNALYADKRRGDARWLADKAFRAENITAEFIESDVAAILSATKDASEVDTGDDAQIGSSGDGAQIGSSGDYARIGSSGDDARIGSSGDDARIGSSGDYARIGSSGYGAQIGSSGDDARIGSPGYGARIGSSGDYAQIGSSGYGAQIGSSGDDARIGSSGYGAQIGSSGDYARIECTGENVTVAFAGRRGAVSLGKGGCASLVWHDGTRNRFVNIYEGEDGIEAGVLYRIENGKAVRA